MPPSKSDTHLTPMRVWQLILMEWGYDKNKFYDPCPADTPYKAPCFFNGLYGHWKELNFVNPPYSKNNIEKFVIKAISQAIYGRRTVMLLPSKTDQGWFHMLKGCWNDIVWIRKRLKFDGNKHGATQPHFLVMIQ